MFRVINSISALRKGSGFICDECESVWETLDDLMNNEWISLNTFASKYNINPNWNEFSRITNGWYSED